MISSMPNLEPIRINTKDKSFFYKLFTLFTVVRKWRVANDWYHRLPDGNLAIIPHDFIFDGASVPKIMWWILSPVGVLLIQGLIHDFGYRYNYIWIVGKDGKPMKYMRGAGRKEWDSIFLKTGLNVNGMTIVDYITWALLRLFGWMAWNKNRRLNSPELVPG